VYASLLGKSRVDVLVLDDFLLNPMTDIERRDLLEVIKDRYDKTSTVIMTQMPTKNWYEALSDPTIADAICDPARTQRSPAQAERPVNAAKKPWRLNPNPPNPSHSSRRSDHAQVLRNVRSSPIGMSAFERSRIIPWLEHKGSSPSLPSRPG
jgi:hypothetical protein